MLSHQRLTRVSWVWFVISRVPLTGHLTAYRCPILHVKRHSSIVEAEVQCFCAYSMSRDHWRQRPCDVRFVLRNNNDWRNYEISHFHCIFVYPPVRQFKVTDKRQTILIACSWNAMQLIITHLTEILCAWVMFECLKDISGCIGVC